MEVADRSFVKALEYICAAVRCQTWNGDEDTHGKLARLAVDYRFRAMDLLMGLETDALSTPVSPAPLDGRDALQQGEGQARWE